MECKNTKDSSESGSSNSKKKNVMLGLLFVFLLWRGKEIKQGNVKTDKTYSNKGKEERKTPTSLFCSSSLRKTALSSGQINHGLSFSFSFPSSESKGGSLGVLPDLLHDSWHRVSQRS